MKGVYLYRPMGRGHYPAEAIERAPAYLSHWLEAFPDSQPTSDPRICDFEDWAENAVLLHEARLRHLPLRILDPASQHRISTSGWMTPPSIEDGPVGAMLGYWANSDFLNHRSLGIKLIGQDANAANAASAYAESPVFQRHAGRQTFYADASQESIEQVLTEILGDRDEAEIFAKTVRKEYSGNAVIRRGEPLFRQLCEYFDGLEWEIVQFEGNKKLLLIQDRISCRYEYRFFVVGGKLVTGAGCVEHFTPLDSTEVFDPQMEAVRNQSEVTFEPKIRDQHLAFAQQFVEEFASEHGRNLDYCLDVCLDADGRSVVIELNPPLNCGRYASDSGVWMDAIIERTEAAA